MKNVLHKTSNRPLRGPAWRSIVLCLCSIGLCVLMAPLAVWLRGMEGLLALSVATLACLSGAVLGEFSAIAFQRPEDALLRMLLSMFFRLGVPISVLLALVIWNKPLISAGVAFYLVPQYLLMLAVEVRLAVKSLKSNGAK